MRSSSVPRSPLRFAHSWKKTARAPGGIWKRAQAEVAASGPGRPSPGPQGGDPLPRVEKGGVPFPPRREPGGLLRRGRGSGVHGLRLRRAGLLLEGALGSAACRQGRKLSGLLPGEGPRGVGRSYLGLLEARPSALSRTPTGPPVRLWASTWVPPASLTTGGLPWYNGGESPGQAQASRPGHFCWDNPTLEHDGYQFASHEQGVDQGTLLPAPPLEAG